MARISKLQAEMNSKAGINKVEEFNDEVVPPIEEKKGMQMYEEDKLQSMTNAIRILPPNMRKDGRHLKENIQAICGFMVTPEMLDRVYENFVHEEY